MFQMGGLERGDAALERFRRTEILPLTPTTQTISEKMETHHHDFDDRIGRTGRLESVTTTPSVDGLVAFHVFPLHH